MIKITDNYLLNLMRDNLGVLTDDFSENELKEVTELYLDNDSYLDSDLEDLKYFTGIEKIVLKDLFISISLLTNICNVKSLKELSFYNCNITDLECLINSNIYSLVIDNCIYEDIGFINEIKTLKELYLDNNSVVDLKEIPIIKQLNKLSLNNTNVLNEDYMIYMNEIEYLAISDSGIEDVSILLSMDKLKVLVLDRNQAINNKEFILELKQKNIKVVDYYNRDVVMYYE